MIGRSAGTAPGSPREPRTVLAALRTVPYTWDPSSDALAFGPSLVALVGAAEAARLSTGRAFAAACGEEAGEAWRSGRDLGSGAPYHATHTLRLSDGRCLPLENVGRCFAGPGGAPALARGTLRCEAMPREPSGMRLAATIASDLRRVVAEGRSATLLLLSREPDTDEAAMPTRATLAARLRPVLRRYDRLIALDAGATAVWLDSCGLERAAAVAAGLRETLADGAAIRIGAACAPVHALDADTLVRRAEEALALADERGPVRLFAQTATHRRRGPPAPDLAILAALNGRRIALLGRSVVAVSSREAAWTLARAGLAASEGPPRTIVGNVPADLAPLLDARALELAADHLAAVPEARLALLIHAVTLADPDWWGALAAHLRLRAGIASRLSLSLQEADLAKAPAAAREALVAMRALGVGVALHDVGGGFLTVAEIAALPLDALTIDGVFVEVAARSPDDRLHLRGLVALGHRLGIPVTAPWVEDEDTARALAALGFDHLEGGLAGPLAPLSPASAPRVIASEPRVPRARRA